MFRKACFMLFLFFFLIPACPNTSFSQPTGRDISAADRAAGLADFDTEDKAAKAMQREPKGMPKIKDEEEIVEPKGPAIMIKKINLTGTETFPPETFQPLIRQYEGREVTRPELDALARAIQRDYLRRGVIAACFIPPQDVREGVITMTVVEAKMGELEIQKAPFFTNEMVRNYWTTRPGKPLRYDTISKNLQIMNINPDRECRAILRAGKKPGTTDVLIDQETEFPFHVTATFDKEGVPETGRDRKGIGIRDNNFLFVDDMLIAGYVYGDYFSNKYFYHRFPITNFATTVMYGYSYSKSAPKKDQAPLGICSLADNSTLFVYQDLFYKDTYIGNAYIGMDFKDKMTKYINGTINRDRFRILRVGSKLKMTAWGGVTYFTPEISQGLNGLGARRKNPYSSRTTLVPYLDGLGPNTAHTDDGVENTFTIFKMGVTHKRPLPFNTQLFLNLRSQTSSEKLASQEEMFLGGLDSVRGYPPGEFLADDAYMATAEFLFPPFFLPEWVKLPYGERPLKEEITGVLFYDYAHGERKGVQDQWGTSLFPGQVAERKTIDMSSIGVGARIRFANQGILRLEWGYPIGGDPAITEVSNWRFHISVNFQDSLPRETRRLKAVMEADKMHRDALRLVDMEINRPSSVLGSTLKEHEVQAEAAYKSGDLELAKKHYQEIVYIATTVISQAEEYVKRLKQQEKELEDLRKQARALQKRGDLAKAGELYQDITAKTSTEPLVLNF